MGPGLAKMKKNDQRHKILAKGLAEKKTKAEAMRLAGYSPASIKHHSAAICRQKRVIKELMEHYGQYSNKEIGILSKAQLVRGLSNRRTEPRVMPQLIRTGLEVAGEVGANATLNIQNNSFAGPVPLAVLG